jgi:hypothetical protein
MALGFRAAAGDESLRSNIVAGPTIEGGVIVVRR